MVTLNGIRISETIAKTKHHPMKASIIIQNLKCGGCAKTITAKLSEIKAISDVHVNLDMAKVSFSYQDSVDALLIKEKLKSLGYPSIDSKNGIGNKAKSFISCAAGRITK